MPAIPLRPSQIKRIKNNPAPNVPGYNSLFFHKLTKNHGPKHMKEWGMELTGMCEKEGTEYYYFENDFGIKINVYPDALIERWWGRKKSGR